MYFSLTTIICCCVFFGLLSLFGLGRIIYIIYVYICGWYYRRKNEREMLHNICEEFYKLKSRLDRYHVYLDKSGNVRKINVR